MQKIINEEKKGDNEDVFEEGNEDVFSVQYYKGLKAVWCYDVLNFKCLVFDTPHQEIALDSPNHYKKKKKEGEKP